MQHRKAWLGAALTFGAGDLVTTYAGLQVDGVREMSPTANAVLQTGGFESLVIAKSAVIVATMLIWSLSDEYWTLAVPVSLILFGLGITLWNTFVIVQAL